MGIITELTSSLAKCKFQAFALRNMAFQFSFFYFKLIFYYGFSFIFAPSELITDFFFWLFHFFLYPWAGGGGNKEIQTLFISFNNIRLDYKMLFCQIDSISPEIVVKFEVSFKYVFELIAVNRGLPKSLTFI